MRIPTSSQVFSLTSITIFWAAGAVAAQDATDAGVRGSRSIEAVRASSPPVIDGRLDDAVWRGVPVADGFVQRQPDPGAAATQPTEARVVYDDEAIYVGVRLHDDRPELIAAPLTRRDASSSNSDWMYVMLDSYHDHRTGFIFAVNPRSVKKDYMVYNDADEDISWDPVWEVATSVDSAGWVAEFRIPLSQLRFSEDGSTWGLNLQRRLARNDEFTFWSPWPPSTSGYVSYFGTLTGIDSLRAPRGVELQPYASARMTRAPGAADNPFHDANDVGASVGADVLVGLTSGLTLSGTINPDFGQVEADPAEVNLTAFETFFSEKRPFFVERADVFRFGRVKTHVNLYGKEFFYSRRIGRTPQRLLRGPNYVYVDAPDQSPILGAAKVTGRTGAWTVGLLNAVTGEAEAEYLDPDGELSTTPVEPLTNYLASRVRRDLREGATVLGGMFTATNRAMGDEVFDDLLRSGAYFGGVDFEHAWAERSWTLTGFLAGSHVTGSTAAIERTQRASSRYYQRPDAEHLDLDPARTSLSGHSGSVALQHTGDWDVSLLVEEVSPGFEINDLGFQGRVDYRSAAALIGRPINEPWWIFRRTSAYLFTANSWNLAGDPTLYMLGMGANGQFRNLWNAGFEANIQPSAYDDRLTRGGPIARTPSTWNVSGSVGTDPRQPLSLSPNLSASGNDEGGFSRSVGLNAEWRPSSAVRLQLGPSVTVSRSARQFVATVQDPEATGTFGARHVFADIDRTTVSLTTRVDWTFSPTLSLQLYAQPFLAAGEYSGLKEFATPGTAEFAVYGDDRGTLTRSGPVYVIDPDAGGPAATFEIPDPNFNVRSLRGNAVLRWQYRPGSTLFFVWQQQRSGQAAAGDFALGRDAGEILSAPATNVLLIKATYWLGR